jgi:hypothetical protein
MASSGHARRPGCWSPGRETAAPGTFRQLVQMDSPASPASALGTNRAFGEGIEARLDADDGDDQQRIEATFAAEPPAPPRRSAPALPAPRGSAAKRSPGALQRAAAVLRERAGFHVCLASASQLVRRRWRAMLPSSRMARRLQRLAAFRRQGSVATQLQWSPSLHGRLDRAQDEHQTDDDQAVLNETQGGVATTPSILPSEIVADMLSPSLWSSRSAGPTMDGYRRVQSLELGGNRSPEAGTL